MRKYLLYGAAAATLITIAGVFPAYAGSWLQAEEGWKYLDDGGNAAVSRWIEDNGDWYYLDVHGIMKTGWFKQGDCWYYLDQDGRMATGTRMIRGVTYQFRKDGSLIVGGPGEEADHSTLYAPNVTSAMCTAEYWIERRPGMETVLMGESEIQALNQRILETPETSMFDLASLPETYNGRKMAGSMSEFSSPAGLFLDGQPVPESYYEVIRNNIRNANVTDNMALRYGFAVNRTIMKAYPYGEFLSDSRSDSEWDNLVNTAVRVNEPLAVYFCTADGKYALVKSEICSGWVPVCDIAICRDKAEWEDAQKMEQFLMITGEKIYLEASAAYPEASEKCLTMGTKLELVSGSDELVNNRIPWNSYVVKLPHRNEDGSFSQKLALVPVNRDVHVGYLSFSSAEILRQAFKCLGNRYGWGGMLNSQDCSGFVMDIYKCFGLNIPRNTTWQAAMPVAVTSVAAMTEKEKDDYLETLRPGTIIQFPGHEMIYLGKADGRHYTINDVSSLVSPVEGNTGNTVMRVRTVVVNDLSTRRKSGHTWMEDVSRSIEVWK